ncbi:MAG TPA: histidine kinase N-terminal domain-containing protein [Anaerolineae bacterium]|mgnify:CR=1 FL=1|nr:histidine kinase N-terminal domain-containing protein [Anaerolineae bacterium]
MTSRDNGVCAQPAPAAKDGALLRQVMAALPILADLSRTDLLLYRMSGADQVVVEAQARPNSLSPLYPQLAAGTPATPSVRAEVLKAFAARPWRRHVRTATVQGAPVARELLPIYGHAGRAIAVLGIDTSWLAHERQLRRSIHFRRALHGLQETALRGELAGAEDLAPFGEHDGVMVVDVDMRIRYVSGIAANLYRRLGYAESLVGQHISVLETRDEALALAALHEKRCLEEQATEHDFAWVRKALPFRRRSLGPTFHRLAPGSSRPAGVIVTIHDATEALRREQELKIKSAMIQEIHHRVKNNLQTIASLLRLQARRASDPTVIRLLEESVSRILSVAVVHEFLSQNESAVISIREVGQRILGQTMAGVVDPSKRISLKLQGGNLYLPTQQATVCALVLNELVQNALEHGYDQRDEGLIVVTLRDDGEQVTLLVEDDGEGLPEGFSVAGDGSLGLRIVQTLVEADLKGRFMLENARRAGLGVKATVVFPKSTLGGEGRWNARG